MGQILHRTATTTHVTRAKIQADQEGILKLAERYGINPKMETARFVARLSTGGLF